MSFEAITVSPGTRLRAAMILAIVADVHCEIDTTFSFFVADLLGFAAGDLAFFGISTFATSSSPLRCVVVGFATSATFTFFAEACFGVAVAFVFFTVSAI